MALELPAENAEVGVDTSKKFDAKTFIDHVIPESIAEAMSENDILPIVIFALFFLSFFFVRSHNFYPNFDSKQLTNLNFNFNLK